MTVEPVATDPADVVELDLFLEALHRRWHYDFRSYSRASLIRRAELARDRLGCASLSELQGRLLRDPAILPDVIDAMTVQVSELFRDPSYYLALRREVVPHLRTFPSLKVWVAGCATGEEAYTLAILLRKLRGRHRLPVDRARAILAGDDVGGDVLCPDRAERTQRTPRVRTSPSSMSRYLPWRFRSSPMARSRWRAPRAAGPGATSPTPCPRATAASSTRAAVRAS